MTYKGNESSAGSKHQYHSKNRSSNVRSRQSLECALRRQGVLCPEKEGHTYKKRRENVPKPQCQQIEESERRYCGVTSKRKNSKQNRELGLPKSIENGNAGSGFFSKASKIMVPISPQRMMTKQIANGIHPYCIEHIKPMHPQSEFLALVGVCIQDHAAAANKNKPEQLCQRATSKR